MSGNDFEQDNRTDTTTRNPYSCQHRKCGSEDEKEQDEFNLTPSWISLDIPEIPSMSCVCDEGLIRRTIENLLDNAVKYTPTGGSVKLSLSPEKGKILVTIANTCEPIEKKELENLFEPFYRGQRSHLHAEGKGLGLYIVQYIVRSHGGKVSLNKADENTFSVTVTLPAK